MTGENWPVRTFTGMPGGCKRAPEEDRLKRRGTTKRGRHLVDNVSIFRGGGWRIGIGVKIESTRIGAQNRLRTLFVLVRGKGKREKGVGVDMC